MEENLAVTGMVVIAILALLASVLFFLLAIVGIFKPAALFFALPEMRTRKHAFYFPSWVSATCLSITVAAAADGWLAWLFWLIAGIAAFNTFEYVHILCGYKQIEDPIDKHTQPGFRPNIIKASKLMKTVLSISSFFFFSTTIALWTYPLLQGKTWPVLILGFLAAASAIWALAGLYDPRVLFFADPTNQNRKEAFFFPFKLFLLFAFCAAVESVADPGTDGIPFMLFGGILSPFIVLNANNLRNVPLKLSKTALAKYCFAFFSALIVVKTCRMLQGEIWLVWVLGLLAAASAIWALAGLYNPNVLYFAHPTNQTRSEAFAFPFKLFLLFAFCAAVESFAEPGTNGIPFAIIGGFLLPFRVVNAINLAIGTMETM